jgi:hypothetical protein
MAAPRVKNKTHGSLGPAFEQPRLGNSIAVFRPRRPGVAFAISKRPPPPSRACVCARPPVRKCYF